MESNLSKVYAEILEILSYMEKKYVEMIPQKLLNLFEKEKEKNYQPNINPNISLAEQNLHRKTLALLAMLNLNYWCENEEEKQKLIKAYAENDKKKELELREKYNPDNLFKKKQENIEKIFENSTDTQMIEYKEMNFIQKILNKIRKLFRINRKN